MNEQANKRIKFAFDRLEQVLNAKDITDFNYHYGYARATIQVLLSVNAITQQEENYYERVCNDAYERYLDIKYPIKKYTVRRVSEN